MRLSATSHLVLPLLAVCPTLLPACGSGPGAGETNVILVTLDTTRADYFSTYGYEADTTPNFDALGEDGLVFELAVSTAAVTPVSHAAILTGRFNHRHRLRVLSADGGYRLPDDVPTLASVLKQRGYSTAAVHSAFPVSSHFGFERDFDVFEDMQVEITRDEGDVDRWSVGQGQRRSDATTDLVQRVLADLQEPYFLWIHYWDPHDIKQLPPEGFRKRWGIDSKQLTKQSTERYAAEVAYVDQQFGRLIKYLEDNGQYDRTAFAVTADHGEGLGEHDWISHRLLYQEQIHVPLIVRLPEGPRGVRHAGLVRTVDVAPTLLAALDIPLGEADGRDLVALAQGGDDSVAVAFADQINGYDNNAAMLSNRPDADFLYMAMDGQHKLIYKPNHPDKSELYDYAADPDEAHNLWNEDAGARRRMLLELARNNAWVTSRFEAEVPMTAEEHAQKMQQLEALGYAAGGESPDAVSEDFWRWTCVDHTEELAESRGLCSRCNLPLYLIRQP